VNVWLLQGYLLALGMARTAQVKRDARIGEAEAKRDSGIKVKIIDKSCNLSFTILLFHTLRNLNTKMILLVKAADMLLI